MPEDNESRATPVAHSAAPTERPDITLMIATDRPPLLDAMLARLKEEPDFDVVGAPIKAPNALWSRLFEQSPGLLLLDFDFLGRIGSDQQLLHRQFPQINVLLVCDAVSPEVVDEVVGSHFRGFILAGEPHVWARAIRRVAQGELWLPRPLLADAVYRHLQRAGRLDRSNALEERAASSGRLLTHREVEVVRALRGGLANKEIAEDLGIEEDTVKKHLRNVYRKLGIRRRSQLLVARLGGHLHDA